MAADTDVLRVTRTAMKSSAIESSAQALAVSLANVSDLSPHLQHFGSLESPSIFASSDGSYSRNGVDHGVVFKWHFN